MKMLFCRDSFVLLWSFLAFEVWSMLSSKRINLWKESGKKGQKETNRMSNKQVFWAVGGLMQKEHRQSIRGVTADGSTDPCSHCIRRHNRFAYARGETRIACCFYCWLQRNLFGTRDCSTSNVSPFNHCLTLPSTLDRTQTSGCQRVLFCCEESHRHS